MFDHGSQLELKGVDDLASEEPEQYQYVLLPVTAAVGEFACGV